MSCTPILGRLAGADPAWRLAISTILGWLKDCRRIHIRYDRCDHTFMSAIAIAAVVIFRL
jgi:transposase